MNALKVLFVGGSGIISSACSALAVERGMELYLLNRGHSTGRPVPAEATILRGDIRDPESVTKAINGLDFDAVVDWVAFTPEHVRTDVDLFRGRTRQYVFISSASAYQTPPARLPIVESTPLANPFWQYSRDKIACEDLLVHAYRADGFPATIVRPSHTYDRTTVPFDGGWTVLDRMRRGTEIVVHGDGTSLWTLTHHTDFARGFVGLLGNPRTIGDAFHITSDEVLTWNEIYEIIGHSAAVPARLLHLPSEFLPVLAPDWFWSELILGDLAHSAVFDNSKIRRFVPAFRPTLTWSAGARRLAEWRAAHPDQTRPDPQTDTVLARLVEGHRRAVAAVAPLAP
jgi:nucleoside-diphosphate-sugar epimerase